MKVAKAVFIVLTAIAAVGTFVLFGICITTVATVAVVILAIVDSLRR